MYMYMYILPSKHPSAKKRANHKLFNIFNYIYNRSIFACACTNRSSSCQLMIAALRANVFVVQYLYIVAVQ